MNKQFVSLVIAPSEYMDFSDYITVSTFQYKLI